MSIRVEIIEDGERREFLFDPSTLTSKNATQKEAEANYVLALIRGFKQRAYELVDREAEGFSREVRQEEKRGNG